MTSLRTKRLQATTVGLAACLVLAACGRDEGETADVEAQEVGEGEATGDITVWALGAEGEKLEEIAADFEKDNPDASVTVTGDPVRHRPRQDRYGDRGRPGA
jgi:multiple sugar transport system substrate-binding protein